ncbi:alpha/beta hydrolase [Ornithinibacillus sp. JPR2-1]|uniref:alpha/beta fold hydrolase n=1 Tax=Ornithinibacillus sp. JPR2-1 TaxID=2094019 RepID=UPI0031E3B9A1
MILHTVSTGTGDAILFLHQGLQTSETDFQIQKKYFSQRYRVIQVDLRGHGKSVTNHVKNYFENAAVDLKETFEHLTIENAHIVGSSLGAMVGLVFAKRYPDKVKSLTLSGIMPHKPDNWAELNKEDTDRENTIANSKDAIDYFNEIHEGDWLNLLKDFQSEDWYPFQETGDLSSLQMPTMLLVGEENPLEVIGAVEYPKQLQGIHVSVIPFAGHLPHMQQPKLYNLIVEQFLEKTSQ